MRNGRQYKFYKHIEKARLKRIDWSVEADTLERAGRGVEAALARTRADDWLRFERKVGEKIWF